MHGQNSMAIKSTVQLKTPLIDKTCLDDIVVISDVILNSQKNWCKLYSKFMKKWLNIIIEIEFYNIYKKKLRQLCSIYSGKNFIIQITGLVKKNKADIAKLLDWKGLG